MRELRITNLEPLILDPDTGISNERNTLEYIPASRLRGAIFAALPHIAPGVKADELLAYHGPRWSCVFPADDNWQPLRPRPRCSKKVKGHPVHWYQREGNLLRPVQPRVEVNMGHARHYGRRAHRDTALYARSALSPGQRFVAWVDSDLIPVATYQMSIGTRRSVTGLCNVEVVEPEELPFENLARDREHVLMLLSDAIVPGPQGGYLRGLDDDALSRVLGCDVTVLAAYSSWHTVGAWSGVWGKPRESAIAIEAGSVWLVEADSDCLESCAQEGIGVRRFEGYGWVELDPDYIEEGETNGIWKLESCIGEASQAEDLKQTSEHWPGLEQVVLGNLEAILETVGNGQTPKDSAEVKRQITALTREANPDPCELFRLHVLLEQSKSKEW